MTQPPAPAAAAARLTDPPTLTRVPRGAAAAPSAGGDALWRAERISQHSEAGIRRNNEDYCGFQLAPGGRVALLVLSDGMGGHASGEVASRAATEFLLDAFARHFGVETAEPGTRAVCGGDPRFAGGAGKIDPFGETIPEPYIPGSTVSAPGLQGAGASDMASFEATFAEAIVAAHEAIHAEAARDSAKEGMGATLVAVLAGPGRIVVAHVGDSRAVQFREDRVRRLTRDHLFVVDALGLTENVAKRHPQGNILSQALGARDPIQPTLGAFDAAPGDQILLCSDGVSEVIGEQEMFDLLLRAGGPGGDPAGCARALVAAALAAGSRDNCTALVATLP